MSISIRKCKKENYQNENKERGDTEGLRPRFLVQPKSQDFLFIDQINLYMVRSLMTVAVKQLWP